MKEITQGDLVSFNSAGQRKKTLGFVMSVRHESLRDRTSLKILWSKVGDFMPRKDLPFEAHTYGSNPAVGEVCWHPNGPWFEVVQCV